MKHCVLCKKFKQSLVDYKEPIQFETYMSLPPKERQEICSNNNDTPSTVLRCEVEFGPTYCVPGPCRFAEDCMNCHFFHLSRFESEDELPRWLLNRKEDFEFPLVVVYCSKRKKSSQLIVFPEDCNEFDLKDD